MCVRGLLSDVYGGCHIVRVTRSVVGVALSLYVAPDWKNAVRIALVKPGFGKNITLNAINSPKAWE